MYGLLPKHLGIDDPDTRRPTDHGMIRVVLPAAALALAGVIVGVTPVGAQSPDPTAPVASPEAAIPSPEPELGVGTPTMSAERDGVRLEVWLDQTNLPVGERLHALVRVSNTGTTDVLWQTNICGTGPAETTIAPSRPPDTGVEWTGRAATFKRTLLASELGPEGLWDVTTIDLEIVGCDLWSGIEPFEPGSSVEMTVAWDAVDRPGRPIVPGPATVTSTFETWTPRERPAQPGDRDQELVASTTIEIVGETGTAVPIGPYADIALSDDSFRTWVETRKLQPRSWDPYASYWPNDDGVYPDDPRYEGATEGTVDIGMFVGNGPQGEVTIDLATLEVLGSKLDGKVEVGDEEVSAMTSAFEPFWRPLDAAAIPFDYTCGGLTFTTSRPRRPPRTSPTRWRSRSRRSGHRSRTARRTGTWSGRPTISPWCSRRDDRGSMTSCSSGPTRAGVSGPAAAAASPGPCLATGAPVAGASTPRSRHRGPRRGRSTSSAISPATGASGPGRLASS